MARSAASIWMFGFEPVPLTPLLHWPLAVSEVVVPLEHPRLLEGRPDA